MPLSPGSRIGAFEIHSLLGAGGMGEVYRATDTHLGRAVAIKILPDAFAHDPERVARFEREARALASLNHPHIATIHGVEKSGNFHALVMELVQGPTLADRIAQGPLPVDDALVIARQIAEALEAAHEQGVVHRDLKPANVKVRPDGAVKVLDFGLAKAVEPAAAATGMSQLPTITTPAMTQAGTILGTAAYMSPEQARGRAVDQRADIWAFGCVVYEMLTARRAFDADDVSLTLARVMEREPDLALLPAATPDYVRQTLRICLRKDPKQRVHHISDVRLLLEGAFDTHPRGTASDQARQRKPRLAVWAGAAAAVLAGAIVAGAAVWYWQQPGPQPTTVLTLDDASIATLFVSGITRDFTVTPDGRKIVFLAAGRSELIVRDVGSLETTKIQVSGANNPFVSPKGDWIGFAQGRVLKKVQVAGSTPVVIGEMSTPGLRGATWGDDDTIVFASDDQRTGLLRISADGGAVTTLTTPDIGREEVDHHWPEFLPGGRAVLFTVHLKNTPIQSSQIAVLDLASGTRRVLISGGSHAQYVSSGHLVYGSAGTLRAVPFDLERLEVTGDPIPVLSPVTTTAAGAAHFVVTNGGTLAYMAGGRVERRATLVWVDRRGLEEPLGAPPRFYRYPRVSPDGRRVAVDIRDSNGQEDVWIWELGLGAFSRLTLHEGRDTHPIWAPGGRRVFFTSSRDGPRNIYWQAADGTGEAEPLTEGEATKVSMSVAGDGSRLVFREGMSLYNLLAVRPGGQRTSEPVLVTPFSETSADISPDGRWLAYDSDESGQREVYVRPFPDVASGRWTVSANGGSRPLWSRDGRELFFVMTREPDATAPFGLVSMMRVAVTPGRTWTVDRPSKMFEGGYFFSNVVGQIGEGRNFDLSADSQRFLMIKELPDPDGRRPEIFVAQNWTEELKRRVPTR